MDGSRTSETPMTPAIASFLDVVERGYCHMDFEFSASVARQDPSVDWVRMGEVNVLRHRSSGRQQCWRLREHIARDVMEYFIIAMPTESRYRLCYGGVSAEAPADSFVMLSTARPFQACVSEHSRRSDFAAMYVRVPAAPVRARVPRIDDLCGHFVEFAPGITRAMQRSFDTALAEGPFMDDDGAQTFGDALIDVMCAVASQALGDARALPGSLAIKEQILLKARRFIDAHLADPDIGHREVAQHCRISSRYLHTVFTSARNGMSCTRYIREQRLLRCRQALRNPAALHRRAADIAADWGFYDAPGFVRLYKVAFGVTPGKDRPRELAAKAATDSD